MRVQLHEVKADDLVLEFYTHLPTDMESVPSSDLRTGVELLVQQSPEHRRKMVRSLARAAMRWSVAIWGMLDICFGLGAFLLAHYFSLSVALADPHRYSVLAAAMVFALMLACFCYAQGLYENRTLASFALLIRATAIANVLALACTLMTLRCFAFATMGRLELLYALVLSTASIMMVRLIGRALARSAKVRIMFVGTRSRFRPLRRELRSHFRGLYEDPIYLEPAGSSPAACAREVLRVAREKRPDELIVEDDAQTILHLLRHSETILGLGCEIRSHAAYFEELLKQVDVEVIDHRSMLGSGLRNNREGTNFAKRLLDIAISSAGLVIASPIFLLCAACIRLSSVGPIIYRQTRVGRYGRLFCIYKFRTMWIDAERNGPAWATSADDRVTPVGRILRRLHLDELPQLWNVLRGEMSLVGPRPERPEFVNDLRRQIPYYDLRHLVPPGITGWAQVKFRYGASVRDAQRKLSFDLYYVRHYSPTFDLAICLRTALAIAQGGR